MAARAGGRTPGPSPDGSSQFHCNPTGADFHCAGEKLVPAKSNANVLFADGMAKKSKVSRVLTTGNLACQMPSLVARQPRASNSSSVWHNRRRGKSICSIPHCRAILTTTSASWLNKVERVFRDITQNRTPPRRLPRCGTAHHSHRRLHRRTQSEPQLLHLERQSQRHPEKSHPRAVCPRTLTICVADSTRCVPRIALWSKLDLGMSFCSADFGE